MVCEVKLVGSGVDVYDVKLIVGSAVDVYDVELIVGL